MIERCFLSVALLLLTACSAPKPPEISGKPEPVNLATPKVVMTEQDKERHF